MQETNNTTNGRKTRRNVKKDNKRVNSRSRKPKESTSNSGALDTGFHGSIPGNNDSMWYKKHPELMVPATQIPFTEIAGEQRPLNVVAQQINTQSSIIPWLMDATLMTLEIKPTIGESVNQYSAVNQTARLLFDQVVGRKSQDPGFDAPDLMLYHLALAQIYEAMQWAARNYGFIRLYEPRNLTFPDTLLYANNCNPDEWKVQSVDFVRMYNELVTRLAQIPTAKSMDLFQRSQWKYQYLYTEGLSVREQLYMLVPAGFLWYTENTDNGAGALIFKSFSGYKSSSAGLSMQDIIKYLNDMITAFLDSHSNRQISTWILNAIPDFNLNILTSLDPNYMVSAIFSPEVLNQIKNATIITQTNGVDVTVKQDVEKNILVSRPQVINDSASLVDKATFAMLSERQLLNSVMEVPSIDDIIINTRLKAFLYPATDSIYAVQAFNDIVVDGRIYYGSARTYTTFHTVLTANSGLDSVPVSTLRALSLLSQFKYSPAVYVMMLDNNVKCVESVYEIFESENTAIVEAADVDKINMAAWLSLLDCPSIGQTISQDLKK